MSLRNTVVLIRRLVYFIFWWFA